MQDQNILSYVTDIIRKKHDPPRECSFSRILILSYTSYSGSRVTLGGLFILAVSCIIFIIGKGKTPTDMIIKIILEIFIGGFGMFCVLGPFFASLKICRALKIGITAHANIVKIWEKEKGKKKPQDNDSFESEFKLTTNISHPAGSFENNIILLNTGTGSPKIGDKIFVLVDPQKKKVLVNYGLLWELS